MFVWPWVYLNLPVESCNGGISASVLIKSQGKPNHADMFWHNLCSPLKVKRSYFGPGIDLICCHWVCLQLAARYHRHEKSAVGAEGMFGCFDLGLLKIIPAPPTPSIVKWSDSPLSILERSDPLGGFNRGTQHLQRLQPGPRFTSIFPAVSSSEDSMGARWPPWWPLRRVCQFLQAIFSCCCF